MRIGCLQFAPQVGDIDNNLNRADAVLNKANPENLDLLVLPELAFTGYNFKSLQQISPFLESRGSGISALWARTTALKLDCVVTVGYPEKVDVKSKWPTSPEYYNSVIAVNSDGETIAHYRKTFLYYTDETWALEGPEGFYGGFIPELGTTTSMGICIPYKFEAPWLAFEFAFHCLEVEANLVIVTMAWLTREDASLFCRMPNEPDMDTLTYWISRLEPLIRSESREEIIVVFCNRTGIESDAVYAGTSAVIGVKDGEVNVYGILGRGEKDLLVVDTEKPPYAKVVYRPDDQFSEATPVLDSASGFGDTGHIGSEQSATTKSTLAQTSPKSISAETAEANTAQDKAQVSGRISRQKKARSLPTQISSLPATGTSPKEMSPQSFTGSARFPSDTPLGTPTELRRQALARADSPTLSVDIPVTSQT
ncbi:carbon-nitrogen hydrolase [Xylaria cubensis]|nr:carbon-nitrogen hydrolase [Xylaria cubensis]